MFDNNIEIKVKPPYVFILITFSLISTILALSSNIPISIRVVVLIGFLIFTIFNGFRNIYIRKEYIEILYPFGLIRKKINAKNVTRIKFTKGARASIPFSFRVYYKNEKSAKNFSFNTESIEISISLLVVFLKCKIPIEIGTDNLVKSSYNEAMAIINKKESIS